MRMRRQSLSAAATGAAPSGLADFKIFEASLVSLCLWTSGGLSIRTRPSKQSLLLGNQSKPWR